MGVESSSAWDLAEQVDRWAVAGEQYEVEFRMTVQ
jgi:hypothetical protein